MDIFKYYTFSVAIYVTLEFQAGSSPTSLQATAMPRYGIYPNWVGFPASAWTRFLHVAVGGA